MFKLIQLTVGFFAIVKASEEESTMPINAHGFIQVSEPNAKKCVAIIIKMSAELAKSNELKFLKERATEITESLYD